MSKCITPRINETIVINKTLFSTIETYNEDDKLYITSIPRFYPGDLVKLRTNSNNLFLFIIETTDDIDKLLRPTFVSTSCTDTPTYIKNAVCKEDSIKSIEKLSIMHKDIYIAMIEKHHSNTYNFYTNKWEDFKWIPKNGEMYYFIDNNLYVCMHKYKSESIDEHLIKMNNYFKTQKEAEEMANKIKNLLANK